MKNILIIAIALFVIMTLATIIVIGFNSIAGFSTDVHNDDVAISIAAVAFAIGVIMKFVYDKKDIS